MNSIPTVKELLSKNASLDELRTLSTAESLSVEDALYLQVHILIATSIKEMPKERVPVLLLKNLYSIEESSPHTLFVTVLREAKQSLPFVTAIVLGVLLYNSDLFTGQIVIINVVFLSAAFGFLFYTLFKSKFFIV